jgi:hypothetical protein
MSAPTREDAQLMVQIARWGTELGLDEAMPALFDESFDPQSADAMDKPVRRLLMLGETIGTLVKHDLLSAELMQDWLWLDGVWKRVWPAALRQREKFGDARLYENFEALVMHEPA